MPDPLDRRSVFRRIFTTNAWQGKGTRAGPGSSLKATEALAEYLPKLMLDFGWRSILDAGCGDSLWMPELQGYVGVDIVRDAVAVAQMRHPHRDYRVLDICTDNLPWTQAVFCRDAMQHMSLYDGRLALENFRRSSRWLIASSHRGEENADIETGGWYPINLEAPPFALGTPITELPDGTWDRGVRWPTKLIAVWKL